MQAILLLILLKVLFHASSFKEEMQTTRIPLTYGLLSYLLLGPLFAQNPLIQRWEDSLSHTSQPILQEQLLYQLTRHTRRTDPEKAIFYSERALALSWQSGQWSRVVQLYNYQGMAYRYLGDYEHAKQAHLEALAVDEKKIRGLRPNPYTYLNLSLVLKAKGELGEALRYQFLALEVYRLQADFDMMGNCHNNIGNIYRQMGDYPNALAFQQKALEIRKKHFPDQMGRTYHSLGYVYQAMGQEENAINFYRRALEYKTKAKRGEQQIEVTHINLGEVLVLLGQYEEGREHLEKALRMGMNMKNADLVMEIYRVMGLCFTLQEKYDKALYYFKEAFILSKESEDPITQAHILISYGELLAKMNRELVGRDSVLKAIHLLKEVEAKPLLVSAYEILTKISTDVGDMKAALQWQTRAMSLKDQMFEEQLQTQLAAQLARLEVEKRDEELSRMKAKEKKNLLYRYLMLGILAVGTLGGILVFFIYRNRLQARSYSMLNRQNDQIAATNLALRNANLELEQFLYILSHDLKEPIRNIGGHISLLRRRYHDKLDEDGQVFMGFAMDGVKRLSLLLSDLLQYAQVGKKGLSDGLASLDYVAGMIRKDLQALIEETGATLEISALPKIQADTGCMYELFFHLIKNALKFHREGIPPVVSVGYTWESGRYIFFVRDNGIGIDEEHQSRIFELFQRLSPADYPEGTGIGLAICRKVVNQHEGEIWLKSEPGKGTTFYVSFPDPNWDMALTYDQFGMDWYSGSSL